MSKRETQVFRCPDRTCTLTIRECKAHIRADMTMSRYGWSRVEDFGHALPGHAMRASIAMRLSTLNDTKTLSIAPAGYDSHGLLPTASQADLTLHPVHSYPRIKNSPVFRDWRGSG